MIAGLDHPTQGTISIGEKPVYQSEKKIDIPPEKRNLGMVFQSYAIWPHMTVIKNVMFPLRYRDIPKEKRRELAMEALKTVRLETLAERKPSQLSGGQQQRVALARALVARPDVVLLDEPLSNLDANLREEMCEEFIQLRKVFPMTMIYVTHDQTEAFKLSDRIALLNKGVLEQLASPEELRSQPQSDFVKKFLKL
jgi:iron(III) transport system ATP-binding protein